LRKAGVQLRKFLSLPQEKQNKIVTAAMNLFGEVGYKKAYVSEIASAAGVSKALIFHYFGSKKDLYSYMVYYTGKIVMTEAHEKRDTANKEFFERAIITTRFRLSIISRYPAMSSFIESVYSEDDPEVASDVERLRSIAGDMHSRVELDDVERKKLKDGADPGQAESIIEKYMEGVVVSWDRKTPIDEVMLEVTGCLNMLKSLLYNA